MTRFIYDKFSKDYLETLLSPYGLVEVSKTITSEIKEIDVWFLPNYREIPPQLGLLGRFCQTPSLFEPYRNPVTLGGISDCLSKLFAVREELQREAKRNKQRLLKEQTPRLWILTPTASSRILAAFSGKLDPDWGEGVYFLSEGLGTAVIVIHQLPETPDTLWLRLLGRGGTRTRAIDELELIPSPNSLKSASLQLLYNLSRNLEALPKKSQEDRKFIMRLAPLYQQDREQAVQEGRRKGRQEEAANLVLRLLQRRLGKIPPNLTQQIRELSVEQLEDLGETLLDFAGQEDLIDWLEQ